MKNELQLYADGIHGNGGFLSHINDHSVTIQSVKWQVYFSDHSVICHFWKQNHALRGSNSGPMKYLVEIILSPSRTIACYTDYESK